MLGPTLKSLLQSTVGAVPATGPHMILMGPSGLVGESQVH